MDEIEEIFTQVIFPPIEKQMMVVSENKYPTRTVSKQFDSWIIGDSLYVKCPACGFVFKLETEVDLEEFQRILEEYSMTYFKRIIIDCPNAKNHRGVYEHYI